MDSLDSIFARLNRSEYVRIVVSGLIASGFCLAANRIQQPALRAAIDEAQTRCSGWDEAHWPLARWLNEWRRQRGGSLTIALEDIGIVGWVSRANIIDLAGLADREWAETSYHSGPTADYPSKHLIRDQRPEVIVFLATEKDHDGVLYTSRKLNSDIFNDPEFAANYRWRVMFTHKDFPGDGYFLQVYLRRDVFDEAPPVMPPVSTVHL